MSRTGGPKISARCMRVRRTAGPVSTSREVRRSKGSKVGGQLAAEQSRAKADRRGGDNSTCQQPAQITWWKRSDRWIGTQSTHAAGTVLISAALSGWLGGCE
jgi:hypothetical protein